MTMKNRNSQRTNRRDNTRCLLLNDKVEVRSLEEGFLGSWHAAKVIGCQHLSRSVRYDLLLNDDESDSLVEHVPVSPAIEGDFSNITSDTCRGLIRPSPPSTALESSNLHYGQCVDVFYEDAWWEGVIFDHDYGSQTRRIFFPDQGDELESQIGMLRISQDWNEVTREWTPRKNWVFLELIEEFKGKYPLLVSIKQIWYEVREKNGFQNLKDWTSDVRQIWRDLVFSVLCDNLKISIIHICNELNFYSPIEFSDLKLHDLLETLMDNYHGIVPLENPHELETGEDLNADVDSSRHCQALVPTNHVPLEPIPTMIDSEKAVPNSGLSLIVVQPEYCPEAISGYLQLPVAGKGSGCANNDKKDCTLKAKKHLRAIGWNLYRHERKSGKKELRYTSPCGKKFHSLRKACEWLIKSNAIDCEPTIGVMGTLNYIEGTVDFSNVNGSNLPLIDVGSHENVLTSEVEKEKSMAVYQTRILGKRRNQGEQCGGQGKQFLTKSREPRKLKQDVNGDSLAPTVRSRKRARAKEMIAYSHPNPRTVLSWLIDNGVVLPREKVFYKRKDHSTLLEGKITREGIRCRCCEKIWTLSNFETHAGSKNHRPSSNIFLEDGRSLMDCQSQLNKQKGKSHSRSDNRTGYRNISGNDYKCSVCHAGGVLIMCDRCPSSFHTECLGLKEIPEGDWFCPPCRCEICGMGEHLNHSPVLVCSQCEHLYHVRCLETKGMKNVEKYSRGNWFCRDSCKRIFDGLCESLGKPVPLGIEDMTWTLVKPIQCNFSDDISENSNSKLHIALSVMHECFEPLKEPDSRNDLVEDVIFCRRSNLNRLNFQGFYTILLEKNDELVSTAIVRIFGEKVAEVPLVATRFRYRRLGLCRILMDQLEKKLKVLGVERLVLPAIPTVLNTWTTSFGFSVTSESEKLNFVNNTFLGFEGTTVCHKLLTSLPSSTLSTGTGDINYGDVNRSIDIEMDQDSMVCGVFPADQLEETGKMEQRSLRFTGESKGSSSSQVAISLDQQFPVNY